ncbi:MAG: hypothetical protein R2684_16520 [Pyrinomonadaceae bacterium]
MIFQTYRKTRMAQQYDCRFRRILQPLRRAAIPFLQNNLKEAIIFEVNHGSGDASTPKKSIQWNKLKKRTEFLFLTRARQEDKLPGEERLCALPVTVTKASEPR